jgi:integrase
MNDDEYEQKEPNNKGPRRPLDDNEIQKLHDYFNGAIARDEKDLELRNYTLIFLCLYTGMRISEVLDWNVEDVFQYGRVNQNSFVKEKKVNRIRSIKLNENTQKLLNNYIIHYSYNKALGEPLFKTSYGRLTTRQASNIFQKAFKSCEMDGLLGCHSARKTFAKKVMKIGNNNIPNVQRALGHKSIATTLKYINYNDEEVNNIIDKMEF